MRLMLGPLPSLVIFLFIVVCGAVAIAGTLWLLEHPEEDE